MTMHHIVWQAPKACQFTVVGEGKPFAVTATPVITNYWFGTTVGLVAQGDGSFGYWKSSNVCNPITAWRITQILPRIKTMRNAGSGYDTTLCGLVIALQGDRHSDRMRARAEDLDMSVEELDAELNRLARLWPDANLLREMWDKLPISEQDALAVQVREAMNTGRVQRTAELVHRVEAAEQRLRDKANQVDEEDTLIKEGVTPGESLHQLMIDIGVSNLSYTIGCGDVFEPTHFTFDDLDREIMSELIGSHGWSSNIPLITTRLQPDDASAHHRAGGGGMTMYWTDFGDRGHPRVEIDDQTKEIISVGWDRSDNRFILTLRPVGLADNDSSQDETVSIAELRRQLNGLEPGQRAQWCIVDDESAVGLFGKIFRMVTG